MPSEYQDNRTDNDSEMGLRRLISAATEVSLPNLFFSPTHGRNEGSLHDHIEHLQCHEQSGFHER